VTVWYEQTWKSSIDEQIFTVWSGGFVNERQKITSRVNLWLRARGIAVAEFRPKSLI
jgi:hypothetical protein